MMTTECEILNCDFNEEGHCVVGLWRRLEQLKKEGRVPNNCPWWFEYRGEAETPQPARARPRRKRDG